MLIHIKTELKSVANVYKQCVVCCYDNKHCVHCFETLVFFRTRDRE